MNMPDRSERDERRDAHLRAALRHAPDAAAQPPAHLDAAIRRDAHAAVGRGRSAGGRLARLLGEGLGWLVHPARGAALAGLVLATTVTLMWRDQPVPDPVAPPAGFSVPQGAGPAPQSSPMPSPTVAAPPTEAPRGTARSDAARPAHASPAASRPAARAAAGRAPPGPAPTLAAEPATEPGTEPAPAPAPAARRAAPALLPEAPQAAKSAARPKVAAESNADVAPVAASPTPAAAAPAAPPGQQSQAAPAAAAPAPPALTQTLSSPPHTTSSERRGFRPSATARPPELPAQLALALRDARAPADTGAAVLDWQPVSDGLAPRAGDIVLRTAGGAVEGHVRLDGDTLLWRPLAPGPAFRLVLDADMRARLSRRWADAERVPP